MRTLLILFALLATAYANTDGETLTTKANKLYKEKKYDEAIAVYNTVLEAEPANTEVLKFRGLASSMKGDWGSCVSDLNEAIKIDKTNIDLLNTRAFAYLHTGDFEGAKRDYLAIDALDNGAGKKAQYFIAQNLLRRARSYSMSGAEGAQKALDDYQRVLALVPAPNDIILYERACTFFDLKRYKEALKDLDAVIKIDGGVSKYGDPHAKRAKVRRILKDEKGAKSDEVESKRRSEG